MTEPIENVDPFETPITPPEKVSKEIIKKIIDFFKKEKQDNEQESLKESDEAQDSNDDHDDSKDGGDDD